MGRQRGRLTALKLRMEIVKLIKEASDNGARLIPACEVVGISKRTYERWVREGDILADKRVDSRRNPPKNKLSEEERDAIVAIVNLPEYSQLTPAAIVPKLADKGLYIASESTIYRLLRELKQLKHRGRTAPKQAIKTSNHSYRHQTKPGMELGHHLAPPSRYPGNLLQAVHDHRYFQSQDCRI